MWLSAAARPGVVLSFVDAGPTASLVERVRLMVPVLACLATGALRNPGFVIGILAFSYNSVVKPIVDRLCPAAAWAKAVAESCWCSAVLARRDSSWLSTGNFAEINGVGLEHVVERCC